MSDAFDLRSTAMAIGDPTIKLAVVPVQLSPGKYHLLPGALRRPGILGRGVVVETESMVVYVMDATLATLFDVAFHEMGRTVSYNMAEMQKLHPELERRVGASVGFYWVGDLSGQWSESKFVFNPKKIAPNRG